MLNPSSLKATFHDSHWRLDWQSSAEVSSADNDLSIHFVGGDSSISLDDLVDKASLSDQFIDIPKSELSGLAGHDTSRPVFLLRYTRGEKTVDHYIADRLVPVKGASNFRDYGGYFTDNGRQVVWGKLFRSGHLSQLTDLDVEIFRQLGIESICDFRREDEAKRQPSILPGGVSPNEMPISPGSSTGFVEALTDQDFKESQVDEFMQAINSDLAINHAQRYRLMFDELLGSDAATIIHCSAGKDRTGFGAALVLSALGVDRHSIMEDYLLTNRYVDVDHEIQRWEGNWGPALENINKDMLAVVLGVKRSYLEAAFDSIDSNFDSVHDYLEKAVGLDSAEVRQLQERYLY